MKIIFMGSPDFSVPALDALVEAGHDICAVYCQPPRPAGRGKKDRPTPVQARAAELGLTVRHPGSLKGTREQAEFAALDADIAVVVAYGLILPQAILDAPKLGCVNIHASLLPRWRGAAPIHRAIMAGDTETGICIMQMDAGLDTGPVLSRVATPIGETETTGGLHDRLAAMGAKQIVETVADLPKLTATPQPENGTTYAAKIDKAEAQIDWSEPAVLIDRQIRGLSPFPGAWTTLNGERIKLLQSQMTRDSGTPGQHLGNLTIACGKDAVQILAAQRQGKRAMDARDILRGLTLEPDTTFGG